MVVSREAVLVAVGLTRSVVSAAHTEVVMVFNRPSACPGVVRTLRAAMLVAVITVAGATDGMAASYWWNGVASSTSSSASSWTTLGNWSTSPSSAIAPSVAPGLADDVVFTISSKLGQNSMVSLSSGNRDANSVTIDATGTTVFIRSTTANTASNNLTIGAGGLTVSSAAGPVTFGEADKKVVVKLASSASFTNNSSSLVAFVKAVEVSTGSTGLYTLTLAGSGTGGFRFDDTIANNATTGTLALAVNTAAGALTVLGTANTFTGGVTLTQGVLGLGSSSALGPGAVTVNGGAVASLNTARSLANDFTVGGDFTLGGQGQSLTLNGVMSLGGATRTITLKNSATITGNVSNGGLSLTGSYGSNARSLTLSGNNTYAGGSVVNSGTLVAGSVAAFGAGSVTVNAGGVLDLGSLAIANAITNNGGTILNAAGYAGTQTLLASATYSSLSGSGTLSVGAGGRATLAGSIAGTVATLAGGTADLTSGGALAQASVANAGTFIFSGTANDTLAASFTGAGAFAKESASILALTGSSFFGAGTQITAGGLLVTGSVGGGLVDVATGASIGGAGRIGGNLNLQSGATFAFNAASTLTVGGTTTFGGSFGIANITGLGGGTPDGTYTLISGNVDFTNVTNVGAGNAVSLGAGKSAYLQQGSMNLVVVPEPATLALVCSGGLALLLFGRRRA